ncbi:MAG: hypothetical protein M1539_06005 [Actinobacteria bacterium]|nr:hypothetical protein [Actinomycetota bacterium]
MIAKKTEPLQPLVKSQRIRKEALSVWFAKLASKERSVIEFREKVLGKKYPLKYDVQVPWQLKGRSYDKLCSISQRLGKIYRWSEYEAAVFVLCGNITPNVLFYEYKTSLNDPVSASRITLTLDPALTDKEVAAIYRQERRKILKTDRQGKARFRLQSEKHLRLAIFEAEQPEELTYRQKMKAWNDQFPKWSYKHESNFIRDSKKAVQRLIQPDYFDLTIKDFELA